MQAFVLGPWVCWVALSSPNVCICVAFLAPGSWYWICYLQLIWPLASFFFFPIFLASNTGPHPKDRSLGHSADVELAGEPGRTEWVSPESNGAPGCSVCRCFLEIECVCMCVYMYVLIGGAVNHTHTHTCTYTHSILRGASLVDFQGQLTDL